VLTPSQDYRNYLPGAAPVAAQPRPTLTPLVLRFVSMVGTTVVAFSIHHPVLALALLPGAAFLVRDCVLWRRHARAERAAA
jgi:hypothetical protein